MCSQGHFLGYPRINPLQQCLKSIREAFRDDGQAQAFHTDEVFAMRINFSDEDIKFVLLFQVGCLHPDGHPLRLQLISQQLLFTFWSSSEISSIVFCFIALTSDSLKPFIHVLFVTLIYVEQHNCTCGSQTTACRNWFSPSTRWVPGIN